MNKQKGLQDTAPFGIAEVYQPDANIIIYPGLAEDFIKTVPDNSVSLIVTSPPYNMEKKYEQKISIKKYLATQSKIIRELHRVLKENGSICWQVGTYVKSGEIYPLDIFYYTVFKKIGMFLRNRIIWRYGHGLHASSRFSGRYETILWFTKSDKYIFNLDPVRVQSKYPGKLHCKGPNRGKPSGNPKGKNPSDVWDILRSDWENCIWEVPNVKANHREKTIHQCQFPIELVERCILALTNEGDTIFDPYAGVGSSLIAAIKHNRRAMGSEKEIEYVNIARERISRYLQGNLKIRPLGRPLHTPKGTEKVARVPESWENDEHSIYFNPLINR